MVLCLLGKLSGLESRPRPNIIERMNSLIIYVDWEYFLGLVGTLVVLAYYANGRFTRLETSVEWLKEALRGLKINAENSATKLFDAGSPISLTRSGQRMLRESGLQSYVDAHKDDLVARCKRGAVSDHYQLQSCAFRLFTDLMLDEPFERHLNEFAFANGVTIDLLRRVGAIYFRDLATSGMKACGSDTEKM